MITILLLITIIIFIIIIHPSIFYHFLKGHRDREVGSFHNGLCAVC